LYRRIWSFGDSLGAPWRHCRACNSCRRAPFRSQSWYKATLATTLGARQFVALLVNSEHNAPLVVVVAVAQGEEIEAKVKPKRRLARSLQQLLRSTRLGSAISIRSELVEMGPRALSHTAKKICEPLQISRGHRFALSC